jgi:aminoglycoside phosphotransferase (APT) family kinase protein
VRRVLDGLLREAGLPPSVSTAEPTGRTFGRQVHIARLADGRRVVLRRWDPPRRPEGLRARFLAWHGVPAPALLAASPDASLHEFADGELLGDLIERGEARDEAWRLTGRAFRRVHEVRFPAGLSGDVGPDRITLHAADPVAQMHAWIDECGPGLARRSPTALAHLPALHRSADRTAERLRAATASLLHGDVSMWNVVVGEGRAWLIDWEEAAVGDPARELALLDKHASLFDAAGVPPAFYEGYGGPPPEPVRSLHRVVQTVRWAASSDWESFAAKDLPADLHRRTRDWLAILLAYVERLPEHLERLRRLGA